MNYKFKTKPFAHQLKALKRSWNKPYFAYFMEMGTGKSKVLIDNISMLYDQGKIDGALIVAPKGVYKNWYDQEIPTHMVKHIDKKMVLWQAMISQKQQKELDSLFKTGEDLHILIMNVEALSTQKGVDFAKKFLFSHRALMAVDESTTIKNPDAKRTKSICDLGLASRYNRILTGSPVTKSPLDLFKQCEFLQPELLGFSSYYAFRSRFAKLKTMNYGGKSFQLVTGYKNLDELAEIIKPFSERILKKECLDLPPKTYIKRTIQLSTEQQKLYNQMKRMAIAELHGKTMTTATALVQLMRLQQITCGHFKADDGTVKQIKNNRISELLSVLDEVEGKAIIWCHWRHDIQNVVAAITKEYGPRSVVTYYGDTTSEQRQKAIKEIQNPDSEVRFLIGTPQTGGYGITLTEANTMIYFSNGYDLEKRTQSEARIDRIGQTRSMTYVDIIAEKTVDEKIVKALRKKIDIASQIMGEKLEEWI
jgi:SNF2 family DNA or RNA helicase